MKEILKRLKEKPGFSVIERSLGLKPFGLLSEWEKDVSKIPPDGVALLRIVETFPWLTRLADNKYKDPERILVEEAVIRPEAELQEKIKNKNW